MTSVQALENLLLDAKARMADVDSTIDANNKNSDACQARKIAVQSEIDDLQTSINVLKGLVLKEGRVDPGAAVRKNIK